MQQRHSRYDGRLLRPSSLHSSAQYLQALNLLVSSGTSSSLILSFLRISNKYLPGWCCDFCTKHILSQSTSLQSTLSGINSCLHRPHCWHTSFPCLAVYLGSQTCCPMLVRPCSTWGPCISAKSSSSVMRLLRWFAVRTPTPSRQKQA